MNVCITTIRTVARAATFQKMNGKKAQMAIRFAKTVDSFGEASLSIASLNAATLRRVRSSRFTSLIALSA